MNELPLLTVLTLTPFAGGLLLLGWGNPWVDWRDGWRWG
jgi:hypothetical protein